MGPFGAAPGVAKPKAGLPWQQGRRGRARRARRFERSAVATASRVAPDDQVLVCPIAAQALTLAIGKNSFSACSESSRNPYLT